MKMDPSGGRQRIDQESKDRLEVEDTEFYNRVYEGYLTLEKKFPERIIGIDGSRPIEVVWEDIRRNLDRILEGQDERS